MKNELKGNIIRYKTSMAMFKDLLKRGIITAEEYAKIDTIIAKKYGVNSCSIFR